MLFDRRNRSFLDARVLSRLSSVPLFARKPMQGTVSGRNGPQRSNGIGWV